MSPSPSHPADGERQRRALRAIATFEAAKGVLALLAGVGLLGLVHPALHPFAASLIGHVGLAPGGRYPVALLHGLDQWLATDTRTLLALIGAYAAVRFTEAVGLWRGRAWGEWVGALSGGLYIPFELRHLAHRPGAATALVIAANAALVVYLAAQLRRRARQARPGAR